jgi:amylosucrase
VPSIRAADAAARIERAWPDAMACLEPLYAADARWAEAKQRVIEVLSAAARERPDWLRDLDVRRLDEPHWFHSPAMAGYSTYVDRFAGDLSGVAGRIDYLRALGINVLHLLPVMAVRDGANDGGFAMASHTGVDPRWGTNADLVDLARSLNEAGISLTLDLLCNHTASTHPWALAAAKGDSRYADHYLFFDSAEATEAYESSLDQVFPQTARGNFSPFDESGRQVWTTFYPYQWDLNYRNPLVFADMLEVMLDLSNLGATTLRLDSVAYLWKEQGTSCKNLPQTHALLAAFSALTSAVAPALLLKAEAIVETASTTAYLGGHGQLVECHLAYNNPLMVALWSALADGSASELADLLERLPPKPDHASWINYLRCHDDIGWMLLARDRGEEGAGRARFLSDFYAGQTPDSWASGDVFQSWPGAPVHGGVGMTASLAGLETALWNGDHDAATTALDRIVLLHALAAACPGTPTLWMGDEIGLLSARDLPDGTWAGEDARALNRPFMDWQAAARRCDAGAIEGRLFTAIARILSVRAATVAFHAANPVTGLSVPAPSVIGFNRGTTVTVLANLGGRGVTLDCGAKLPLADGSLDLLGSDVAVAGGRLTLPPLTCVWLSVATETG